MTLTGATEFRHESSTTCFLFQLLFECFDLDVGQTLAL